MAQSDSGTTDEQPVRLDQAQKTAAGDMPTADLRAALHHTADLVADYLEHIEDYAVLPPIKPGELTARLATPLPQDPEPLEAILRDVEAQVIPNVTHWQHPGYMAYFPSSGSGIGLLGEMITTGLNANAMLWRTSPVGSELEAIAVGWLREGLGLPPEFDGLFTDTASTSSLTALAAARQHATGNASQLGLKASPPMRFYTSAEAHSSIERAGTILGIGRDGVRKIAVDDELAMDAEALRRAIRDDRDAGLLPGAVVATIGTTATTAIDPTSAIADICAEERVWLHVDAAYAGPTALIPEMRHHFAGWERADSIVVNPHKWMFTPLDSSLLLTRRMETLREALSVVPEYLRNADGETSGRDYYEYTPQLGRRARGIKMWMQLRYFGLSGLRARLQQHLDLAQDLADWVDAEPEAVRMAPAPFGLVCLRWRPQRFSGNEDDVDIAEALDTFNERLLERLNESGEVFLSHARIDGRFVLRVAVGNIRTKRRHVERTWQLIGDLARQLDTETP